MRHLLIATAMLALAAAPGTAPAQTPATPAQPGAGTRIDAGHIRAKQMVDRDVVTTDGTEVGEIEDLVIDPGNGRVVSAIIEVETRLGLTDKYVSVELGQLRVAPGERRVTINMGRDELRSLPGINYND